MSSRTFCDDAKVLLLVSVILLVLLNKNPFRYHFVLDMLIFVVPLFGVLVRFRVNYTPKEEVIRTEGMDSTVLESGQQVRTGESRTEKDGEKVRGYAHMLRKVFAVERWRGLYKSTVPCLLFWLTSALIRPHVRKIARSLVYRLPYSFISFISAVYYRFTLETAAESVLFVPVKVTFLVLTCRAITTDVLLPFYSQPLRDMSTKALRALFTPYERAHPLKSLVSPRMRGVVLCELLRSLYAPLVFQPLRSNMDAGDSFLLRLIPVSTPLAISVSVDLLQYAILYGLTAAILCPLDVVKIRLSALHPDVIDDELYGDSSLEPVENEGRLIQLDDGDAEKKVDEKEGDESLEAASSAEETSGRMYRNPKAFLLRPAPYTGFWHCLRTVIAEEGPRVLLRAWWSTYIPGV